MSRLKLLFILALLAVGGWQGYLFYLNKSVPPGSYRLRGELKPCSFFGDGRGWVEGQRQQAARAKRRAEKNGDLEEVEFQMRELEEYDAALRYCW
jgi:hypothetical protein